MRPLCMMFLLLALLVGSPLNAQDFQGTLGEMKKSGKIRLGYRLDQPPMSFLAEQDKPEGYSIDLCQKVVAQAEKVLNRDLQIEFVPVSAQDRFTSLAEGKIDLLCGATTKTLSRSEIVDFTQLTFVTGATFMTLQGTKLVNNFDGKKVGVVKGTTTVDALSALVKETGAKLEIVEYTTTAEMLTALVKKNVDAITADQIVLIGLAIASGKPERFSILPDLYSYEPFALAVPRNDSDFRLVANRAIADLYRSREILKIHDKWFGKFATHRSSAFEALIQLNAIPE